MKNITLPLKEEEINDLVCGEEVLLSGTLYTARDAAHKRLIELVKRGEPLPFPLAGATIYYVGPTQTKPGAIYGSAGPTTSSRMDMYTPTLLDLGLKGMIGKGRRSQEVKESIVKNKAIYFVAAGGAGALLGECVKKTEMIAFEDLLSEAIVKLEVKDFPCFVGIDTKGNDIYEDSE